MFYVVDLGWGVVGIGLEIVFVVVGLWIKLYFLYCDLIMVWGCGYLLGNGVGY